MRTNLITTKIVGSEKVITDQFGNNTVSFLADIPENAFVTSVILNGKHLKKSENAASYVIVEYPRCEYYEGQRVVATLHSVYDNNEIINAAKAWEIKEFEVEYFETASVKL